MADQNITAWLATATAGSTPGDGTPAPAPAPAPTPVPVAASAKPPAPQAVIDLLLAPPSPAGADQQLEIMCTSYDVPAATLIKIVETAPAGYTPECLATIKAAVCPDPEPAPEPEPTPEPEPAPKKTRRSRKSKDTGQPLTRDERMQLACAMAGESVSLGELCEFVIGATGE